MILEHFKDCSKAMSEVIFLILRLLITFFLLAFFAWAFWVISMDLKQRSQKFSGPKVPEIILTQLPNPEKENKFGIPAILIGRDISCNLYINNNTLSARHARLSYHHSQWWLEDLNSSNGTYINNEPVTVPIVVTSKDQIRCGEIVLEVDLVSAQSGNFNG